MTSVVRLLVSMFFPATGAVRAGEVVEVPDEIGTHWVNNNLAEDATGQDVTRHTATEAPTGQDGPNEYGQWPAPRPIGEPETAAPAPSAGNFSSMTSRRDMGLAPAEPTTAEGEPTVAEPTSGPMTPADETPAAEVAPEPAPEIPPGHTLEPTPEPAAEPEPTPAPEPEPAADVPFTATGTLHTEPEAAPDPEAPAV